MRVQNPTEYPPQGKVNARALFGYIAVHAEPRAAKPKVVEPTIGRLEALGYKPKQIQRLVDALADN